MTAKKSSTSQNKQQSNLVTNQQQNINSPIIEKVLTNELATTSKNETLQVAKVTSETKLNPNFVTILSTETRATSSILQQEVSAQESDNQTTAVRQNPCISPISYTLGNFDSRFNISKNYFLATIAQSASLWNKAVGQKLFIYDGEGKPDSLAINLIYDQRQQKTDANKLLGVEIENTKEAAEKLQTEYEAMKVTFSQLKDEYIKNVEIFNTRQKTYNDTVTSWNEKGGAPRADYDALNQEKESLLKETEKLVLDRQTLDTMLVNINAKITRHNELVIFANQNVDINNSTAHKKFTEGNYTSKTNSISIYQFNDETKLQRVLTHELGHALGIDHTKDPQSIMYAINSATTTMLAQQDIQEIVDICSKK